MSLRAYRVGRLIVRLTNDGEYTFSSVNTLNLTRLNVVSEADEHAMLRDACPPRRVQVISLSLSLSLSLSVYVFLSTRYETDYSSGDARGQFLSFVFVTRAGGGGRSCFRTCRTFG